MKKYGIHHKWIILTLILCLVSSIFSGCKKDNSAKNTSSQPLGRYVEEEISLPEALGQMQIFYSTTKDNLPTFYACQLTEGIYTFESFSLMSDGSWERESLQWMNQLKLTDFIEPTYLIDQSGNEYLFYKNYHGETGSCHIMKRDGDTSTNLPIEDWNTIIDGPDGSYTRMPRSVAMFENGTFLALLERDCNLYRNDGSLITTLDVGYPDTLITLGTKILCLSVDNRGNTSSITLLNQNNPSKDSITYDYPFVTTSTPYFTYNGLGDLIAADSLGVHLLEHDTSMWQTVVDGSMTSLYLPSLFIQHIVQDTGKNYYVIAWDAKPHLFKYSYDKTIPALPSKELNIYGLEDNATLRQASVLFQKSHPDVKINIQMENMRDTSVKKEELIRTLNTELLAGNGADILLLDGLPIDTYIEKNVLLDLSEIITPMLERKELLENIILNYNKNGSYYSVPIRFSPLTIYGHTDAVNKSTTLTNMISYARNHTDGLIIGHYTPADLISNFLPVYYKQIVENGKTINDIALSDFLSNLKELYQLTGGIREYTENAYPSSIYDLSSHNYLYLDQMKGQMDAYYSLGMVTFIDGSYTNFEHSFQPIGMIGINSKSKHVELSKEFVKLLYTPEVQSLDALEGFSVLPSVLDAMQSLHYEGAVTGSSDKDGNSVMVEIRDLTEAQKEEIREYCNQTTTPLYSDSVFTEKMISCATDYFSDKKSLDETCQTLKNELSIYLTE